MRPPILLLLLSIAASRTSGQIIDPHSGMRPLEHVRPIEVRYERNALGDYEFYSYNNTFSPYVLEVTFSEFINVRAINASIPFKDVVPVGRHSLFILRRDNPREQPRFRYHLQYREGCLKTNPDTAFAYLLPLAPGHSIQVAEQRNIRKTLGEESEPKDWYMVALRCQAGDTVYAARRGVVTHIRDTVPMRDSSLYFSRESNYVEIYHNDCTFGVYHELRQNGIFVQPGQVVEAGQPIGIAGGENTRGGPHVTFAVHYYLQQEILKDGKPTGNMSYEAYVPVRFWTKEEGNIHLVSHQRYTSEHPADLVTREMSKKEQQKWREQHP